MSIRFVVLACLIAFGASLASRAELRADRSQRCALDGARIESAARVDLVEDARNVASFCSIECALAWPRNSPHARFEVHEEQNGAALDPAAAVFVRSDLHARGARGTLRAFRDAQSAAAHVRDFGGTLVPNPFPEDAR